MCGDYALKYETLGRNVNLIIKLVSHLCWPPFFLFRKSSEVVESPFCPVEPNVFQFVLVCKTYDFDSNLNPFFLAFSSLAGPCSGNMEPADANRVRDISNSVAFTALDELLLQQKMSQEKNTVLKEKFQRLHDVVISTYGNEKKVLTKAKQLKGLLESEREKLEQKIALSHKTVFELEALQKEEKEASAELEQLKEQRNSFLVELEVVRQTRKDNGQMLDEKHSRTLLAMEPTLFRLNAKMAEIKQDIEQQQKAFKKENVSMLEYEAKISEARMSVDQIDLKKTEKRSEWNQAQGEPERLKNHIETIEVTARTLQSEADQLLTRIREEERKLNEVQTAREATRSEIEELGFKEENFRLAILKRKNNIDEILRTKEMEKQSEEEMAERMISIEMEKKTVKEALKNHVAAGVEFHKEAERNKKIYERMRRKKDTVTSIIGPLKEGYFAMERDLQLATAQYKSSTKTFKEIQKDQQVFITQCLSQGKLEEESARMLHQVEADGKTVEEEIIKLDKEEWALQQEISKLSSQRELMARDASRATALYRDTKEDLKVKNLILMDLDKQTMETFQRLKTCSVKYEKMKNQRNKLSALTQSSSQALAEMKEKIKILMNEVEILRNESLTRDRALQSEVVAHHASQSSRDALRLEQNKQQVYLKQRKEDENQQLMEIDKLNSIVNSAEKQMIRLRIDYSHSVDNRNKTGIQLIDRNDELCILYEKANIQEAILAKGDEELRAREEDVHRIKLEEAELRRKIEIARKQIPSLQTYTDATKELETLEKDLEEERKLVKLLVQKLETPLTAEEKELTGEQDRARHLGGMDPEPEQVAAKIEMLEERLNVKKELLLEKELVLDEVSSLSTKLRNQAAESRGPSLDIVKKINEYQSKIRTTTRKMMASVSELSMYQATALKLEHQKKEQTHELALARARLGEGLPPTEEAEHEWYRMERDRQRRQEALVAQKQFAETLEAALPGDAVKSTSEPRPNAYISEELGIPKPYSTLPFKPTQLGSTMRHIRKPVVREIQI